MVSLHRPSFSLWFFPLTVGFLCLGAKAQIISAPSDATSSPVQQASTPTATLASVIQRMGGLPPKDSLATANVTITAGSTTETGTMRIVTSGTTQTLEEINLPSGVQRHAFTQDEFIDHRKDKGKGISFEESLSAQSSLFPLPWLAAKAIESDLQVESLPSETIENVACQHLRLSRAWQSDKNLRAYTEFAKTDLWLNSNTGLTIKVAFERRKGWGAVPPIPVSIEYSDYRPVEGIQYPFHIKQYVNGTLWADIHVQGVQFNTGVTASEFSNQ